MKLSDNFHHFINNATICDLKFAKFNLRLSSKHIMEHLKISRSPCYAFVLLFTVKAIRIRKGNTIKNSMKLCQRKLILSNMSSLLIYQSEKKGKTHE